MKLFIVVSGYLTTQNSILMVLNKWRQEDSASWSLPGGTLEDDRKETLTTALKREFLEETGVEVKKVGALLYVVETISESRQEHFINFTYEIIEADSRQMVKPVHDEFVVDVRMVPLEEVSSLPALPSIKEPLLNYLNTKKIGFHQYLKTFSTD